MASNPTFPLIKNLAVIAFVLTLWLPPQAYAWTAGPTGWCTDASGRNYPCGQVSAPGGGSAGAVSGMLLGTIFSMILSEGLASGASQQQDKELAARQARERALAQARAWAAARQQRMLLVGKLREARDAEENRNLEEMSQTLSDQWSGNSSDPLVTALSDPMVVDLRGRSRDYPRTDLNRTRRGESVSDDIKRLNTQLGRELAREKDWLRFQASLSAQRKKLELELAKMLKQVKEPPAPTDGRQVDEGVFLGITNTQYDAQQLVLRGQSPFSGRPYVAMQKKGQFQAFAFGKTDEPVHEAGRGLLDSVSRGAHTLDQEHLKRMLPMLKGTHFKRLSAHSNGATIAEAMLRKGLIRADELNVLGGDRALSRIAAYQRLLDTGKVKRVVVWVNRGDPVPYMASPHTGPARDAAEMLRGMRSAGKPTVEFRFFGKDYWVDKAKHNLEAYSNHIAEAYGVR